MAKLFSLLKCTLSKSIGRNRCVKLLFSWIVEYLKIHVNEVPFVATAVNIRYVFFGV